MATDIVDEKTIKNKRRTIGDETLEYDFSFLFIKLPSCIVYIYKKYMMYIKTVSINNKRFRYNVSCIKILKLLSLNFKI